MSERHLKRRIPMCQSATSSSSILKPSLPSLSYGRNRSVPRRVSKQQHKLRKTIERCKSEPSLCRINGIPCNEDDRRDLTTSMEVLFCPQTCSDIFLSPDYLNSPSPLSSQGYKKDVKVVINVTVEGTPGPIQTMVKLGSSVDETIRLVLSKYKEEGRSPHLDESAFSSFNLYTSYFSLVTLNKSDVIGDVGTRSFHLRKSNGSYNSSREETAMESTTSMQASSNPYLVISGFFARNINKIIRRTNKLWKFLGCIQCFG